MSYTQKLEDIIRPICREKGLHLVELLVKGNVHNPVIQVFADSENGITLGQCEELSRGIKDELDMDDSVPQKYRLDVSSPGTDRPIVEDFEFKKNLGQDLTVKVKDEDGTKELVGKLTSFDTEKIELTVKDKAIFINRLEIAQAKVKVRW